jgi:hypothetical protein
MKALFSITARYNDEIRSQRGFTVEIEAELPSIPAPSTRFAFKGTEDGQRLYFHTHDVIYLVPDEIIEIELQPDHVPDPDALFAFAKANGGSVTKWHIAEEHAADD